MTLSRIQTLQINDITEKYFTLSGESEPIATDAEQPIMMVVEVSAIRNPEFPSSTDMLAGVLNEAEKMAALDELYSQWVNYKQTYITLKATVRRQYR